MEKDLTQRIAEMIIRDNRKDLKGTMLCKELLILVSVLIQLLATGGYGPKENQFSPSKSSLIGG